MNTTTEEFAVARLAVLLAAECGFSPGAARCIRAAALLHDIGKLKIDRGILEKPGKLTPEEMEVMKTHTLLGAKMLKSLQGEIGEAIQNVCLYHHEFYNKAGYWGKAAGDLPMYVPIVGIFDVYVALTNARPYKQAWPEEAALEYIQNQAGTQFSHDLADKFCAMMRGGTLALLTGRTVENGNNTGV